MGLRRNGCFFCHTDDRHVDGEDEGDAAGDEEDAPRCHPLGGGGGAGREGDEHGDARHRHQRGEEREEDEEGGGVVTQEGEPAAGLRRSLGRSSGLQRVVRDG